MLLTVVGVLGLAAGMEYLNGRTEWLHLQIKKLFVNFYEQLPNLRREDFADNVEIEEKSKPRTERKAAQWMRKETRHQRVRLGKERQERVDEYQDLLNYPTDLCNFFITLVSIEPKSFGRLDPEDYRLVENLQTSI
ncbi:Hypothetical protein D9617_28g065360 [Elsinoe fawcettii]|nr:Hypothetical protein D9617_28g065360 [Elsinoe fawcettii]